MITKKTASVLLTVFCMLVVLSPMPAYSALMTLQTANNTTGNQAYSGVGVRFAVNSSISVYDLGIFDSNHDGIAAPSTNPLSAYLFTSTGSVISSITFDNTSQGILDPASGYRFKPITPVTLTPGDYVLAGYGWTSSDLQHNCLSEGACDTFNTGGGLLTYLGSPFGGGNDPAGTFPTSECCGNLNFFSAANMLFAASSPVSAPEPSSLSLLSLGLLGIGFSRRKQWDLIN